MLKKLALFSVLLLATCSFAITIDYQIAAGWNMISVPCSTSYDNLEDIFPFSYSFFIYDPFERTYSEPSEIPLANTGLWLLSPMDTIIRLNCACVDIIIEDSTDTSMYDPCDSTLAVVLNGDTIPEERISRNESGCITVIDMSDMGIDDPECLSGIEMYTSLDQIRLSNNNLTTVNLSYLSGLSTLSRIYIDENSLTSIDLSVMHDMDNLNFVILNFNNLETVDLSFVTECPGISSIYLTDNELTSLNLEPLSDCHDLRELLLRYNNLTSLDLSPLDTIATLYRVYLEGNDFDSASSAHICEFRIEHLYIEGFTHDCFCDYFTPLVLDGDTIPESEITRTPTGEITGIDIFSHGFNSPNCLHGIEDHPFVEMLAIRYDSLSTIDLTPLEGLTNLKTIRLNNNMVDSLDFTPLADLDSLEQIFLEINNLTELDISPLADHPVFRRLSLRTNELESLDMSALSSCPAMEVLELELNNLSSINLTPLASCLALTDLKFQYNAGITTIDLTPLADLPALVYFDMTNLSLDAASCSHVCTFEDENPDITYFFHDCECP